MANQKSDKNIIYKRTNIVNNKYYFGQTWTTPEDRWNHGNGYLHNDHFTSSIKKYGKENFICETLLIVDTQEEADFCEEYLIDKYDSCNPEKGYNIRKGGSRGLHTEITIDKMKEVWAKRKESPEYIPFNLGLKHSEDSRINMSNGRIGMEFTEEHCANIAKSKTGLKQSKETKQKRSESLTNYYSIEENRLAHSGENAPMFNKSMPEEAKQKISVSQSGETNSMAKLTSAIVTQIRSEYATGQFSHADLAIKYGVSKGSISMMLAYKTWKNI